MHRLSSAAMQPSIACASPGARVQEQSTCALLLLHRGTVCMSPGAPAHMRAAAGLRTYARAAASAQPVHIRCLFSTAMMPSLARRTSAVCSLPGAHAHTRSVVCLCWRRGVMRTCTRAGVCWASSTRGMRAARTSQRRSQAGLARRRVRGGVHARRGSCALRLLQCGRARLARRQVRTRFAHTRATVRLHYSAVCTHAGAAVRGFSSTTVLPT